MSPRIHSVCIRENISRGLRMVTSQCRWRMEMTEMTEMTWGSNRRARNSWSPCFVLTLRMKSAKSSHLKSLPTAQISPPSLDFPKAITPVASNAAATWRSASRSQTFHPPFFIHWEEPLERPAWRQLATAVRVHPDARHGIDRSEHLQQILKHRKPPICSIHRTPRTYNWIYCSTVFRVSEQKDLKAAKPRISFEALPFAQLLAFYIDQSR